MYWYFSIASWRTVWEKNTFTTASSITSFLLEPQFCSSNVINTNIRSNLIRRTSAAKVSDFKMYRVCEKKLPDYKLWTPVAIEVYFFVMGVFNCYSFSGKWYSISKISGDRNWRLCFELSKGDGHAYEFTFRGIQIALRSQVSFRFQTALSVGVPVYDAIWVDREESTASSLLLL